MNKPTIKFSQTLFGNVDPKTIDPDKHARYVIERVLDFGEPEEVFKDIPKTKSSE